VGLVLGVGALAAVVAMLAGGRGGAFPARFRRLPLLLAAAGVQLVAALALGGRPAAYAAGLAVSAALAAGFVAANVRVPGVPLVGLGLLLNAAVVGLNGAMPVSARALERAGVSAAQPIDGRHETLSDDTRLGLLGDVIPLPLPFHREVVSPGDVLVAAGVGLLVLGALYGAGQQGASAPGAGDRPQPYGHRSRTRARDSTTRGSYS
jgi:hypothetical protein